MDEQSTANAAARRGGIALIAAALLFVAAFSYLAATFDYPDVLDRPAAEVLPRLLSLGAAGRAVWIGYALLPLLLVPAGIGVAAAFRRIAPTAARAARACAIASGACMLFGLARWPTVQWELARAWVAAPPGGPEQARIAGTFDALNLWLGVVVGEFTGELFLGLFFACTAYAMSRTRRLRPFALIGFVAAASGSIAMFRNATTLVAPVAAVNDYVLPVALIGLGVGLLRARDDG